MSATAKTILSVRGLQTMLGPVGAQTAVIDDVRFDLAEGEVLGIVGESGSGKSITALSIMGLLMPPGKVTAGAVLFDGEDLLRKTPAELSRLRGNQLAMIFQEPMSALNPLFTVGDQIGESLRIHQGQNRRQARAAAIALLGRVEISQAARRVDDYPHQLSGGMRQRVMIAMALACNPRVLIADEPTTALDVTVQAQIFDLLRTLRREMNLAIILITHDFGVIAQFADRALVMYAGRIVESATVRTLFRAPRHPYTRALMELIPRHDRSARRPQPIPGSVPQLSEMPPGCRFAPRCVYAEPACSDSEPPLETLASGSEVACWRHEDVVASVAAASPASQVRLV
ncbi:MAG: ABC transporter ATP-binding protein [Variovorax sp.]